MCVGTPVFTPFDNSAGLKDEVGGLTFGHRFCLHDFQNYALRQLDRYRYAVMQA